MKIRIADVNIQINNKYEYLPRLCKDYMIEEDIAPEMVIDVTDAEIDTEIKSGSECISRGYAESVCAYRSICRRLPIQSDAYLLHAAVVEMDGLAYAFCAKSGVGKSTHVALWKKRFGERAKIINGDKPLLRFLDGRLYAYGTPWCGKEGWNKNVRSLLVGVCFLERAEQNAIRRLDAEESVSRIFHQILAPQTIVETNALIPLLDKTLTELPCFLMSCNTLPEAAEVSYNGMKRVNMCEKENETQ